MKKFLSILAAAALVLSLAACDGSESSSQGSSSSGEESVAKVFKVGLVTAEGGVEDESFNQSAWEGLLALEVEGGYEVTYLESDGEEDYGPHLAAMSENGNDLIWGTGDLMADAIFEAAGQNPNRKYAILDPPNEEIPANVTGVAFKAEEPAFLVGYIAGRMTTKDKVGFIGGVRGDQSGQFEYGYRAGVAYAAQELDKEIEVVSQYAESFTDEAAGKAIALKQYEDGCDIIFHAAGGAGLGLFEAAKELGVGFYAIGVDQDQHNLAPDNILTSAVKRVGDAVQLVSKGIENRENLGGATFTFGLAEGCCGIAPTSAQLVPADILADEAELENAIIGGILVIPSTQEEYLAFVDSLK